MNKSNKLPHNLSNKLLHNFIAEIGTAHMGDKSLAKELIDAAAQSGATTVKFQWVLANEIVSKYAGKIHLPRGLTDIYESFRRVETSPEFYYDLKEYATYKKVNFLCSIFGYESMLLLLKTKPEYIKIASPEINDIQYITKLVQELNTTKHSTHIILSDGISTYVDIARAIHTLKILSSSSNTNNLTLSVFRCVTQYPTDPIMYQLFRIIQYKLLFNCQFKLSVGLSDHTTHPFMLPVLAMLLGTDYTEKHFTLDSTHHRAGLGLDDKYALQPKAFESMVKAVNDAMHTTSHKAQNILASNNYNVSKDLVQLFAEVLLELMAKFQYKEHSHLKSTQQISEHIISILLGQGHAATRLPIYFSTRRSLFCGSTNLDIDMQLSEHNTLCLRSEINTTPGIPAEFFPLVFGYRLKRKILSYQPIYWDDIAL